MAKKINILIVDDHPFIIEAYKNTIAGYHPSQFEFNITQANDCRSAYDIITNPNMIPYDVAFLISACLLMKKKTFFLEKIWLNL